MALIFAFSAMPSDVEERAWWDVALRKGIHFGEYAVLCALWFRALRSRWTRDRALAAAVGICVLYAVTDEFHQSFVDGRIGTPRDVLIDTVGVLVAAALLRLYSQPRSVASSTA
ncbi:MAG TPA: VanZ family protein [Thermoleophilaceae bacterium]|nr:VanZ family protein [Thermoleophilaceae bacterium]